MGGLIAPLYPRHSTNFQVFVLVKNFARASGPMLRVWGVNAAIAPLEAISPPRTEVAALPGVSTVES